MFDIIRLTPSPKWYYPASVELGILARTRDYTPHTRMQVPPGASRVGGPIVDLPETVRIPDGMQFAAMLNLGDIARHDAAGLLPASGFLFFFIGGYGDEGAVFHADCDAAALRRHIVEHEHWFWDGCLIEKAERETEDFASRYREIPGEGREWDSFAGCEKSKVYGIYTHCQREEEEIREVARSSKILLLQIGEDVTGEGVWSVLIEKEDLKRRDFGNCTVDWGQS